MRNDSDTPSAARSRSLRMATAGISSVTEFLLQACPTRAGWASATTIPPSAPSTTTRPSCTSIRKCAAPGASVGCGSSTSLSQGRSAGNAVAPLSACVMRTASGWMYRARTRALPVSDLRSDGMRPHCTPAPIRGKTDSDQLLSLQFVRQTPMAPPQLPTAQSVVGR